MGKPTCVVKDCESPSWARGWCTVHYGRMRRHGTTDVHAPAFISTEDRFWASVKKSPTCWEWQGTKVQGYGHFYIKKDTHKAHRFAYELIVGPIPKGLDLDHICHNRACVNPDHLRPVTHKQNMENRSGPNANSKSGYRGVHWKASANMWSVVVGHHGKRYGGGFFADRHEAGIAARRLRDELFTHSQT